MKTSLIQSLPLLLFVVLFIARGRKNEFATRAAFAGLLTLFFLTGYNLEKLLAEMCGDHNANGFAGGVFLAAIGFFPVAQTSGLKKVFTEIQVPFFVAAGIASILFFIDGSYFGSITESHFGFSYGKGAPAHTFHSSRQLIGFHDMLSLPVHPVQLYAAACFMFSALLFAAMQRQGNSCTNRFAASVCVTGVILFLSGFATENVCGSNSVFRFSHITSVALLVSGFLFMFLSEEQKKSIQEVKGKGSRKTLLIFFAAGSIAMIPFSEVPALFAIITAQSCVFVSLIAERIMQLIPGKKARVSSASADEVRTEYSVSDPEISYALRRSL